MIRLYESPEIADAYVKYRPLHPPIIAQKVIEYCSQHLSVKKNEQKLDLVVDVGCGPGISTQIFQPYCNEIIGIDISAEQLKQAKKQNVFDNVTFKEGSAENIPVEDGSVDLLIAGAAAHWFDLPKFYIEARRVLKPGGCIAFFEYYFTKINPISNVDSTLGLECGRMYNEMLFKGLPDDPKERRAFFRAFQSYDDIFESMPFECKKRDDDDVHDIIKCSVNDIGGMIRSMDGYETFMQRKIKEKKLRNEQVTQEYLEDIDLSLNFTKELKLFWDMSDVSDDDKCMQIDNQYFILLAKI